jgi:hypothetical protein
LKYGGISFTTSFLLRMLLVCGQIKDHRGNILDIIAIVIFIWYECIHVHHAVLQIEIQDSESVVLKECCCN